MKAFALLASACALFSLASCTAAVNPPFEVIRNCHAPPEGVRKCLIRYSVVHDGPGHYRYFISAEKAEKPVFQYFGKSKLKEQGRSE
ncbi:MAG: hypothetical protein HQM13_18935 [SAR324 cluster bacterium]|nr:hypothetical protein [SAR324 cluster bacterium]